MTLRFYPVILSGGSGTRLWPMSRKLLPKQFLALLSRHTLLQETALRVRPIAGCEPPIVVCNDEQRFLAADQLREIGVQAAPMILEPVGRNTAPAIAVAALARASAARMRCCSCCPRTTPSRGPRCSARMPPPRSSSRAAATSPRSASFLPRRIPASATSSAARRSREAPARWRASARSPTAQPPRGSSRAAGSSGTAACSLFSAAKYLDELERLRPEMLARPPRGLLEERARPRLPAPRPRGVRSLPVRLDRLRRHGKDRGRGRGQSDPGWSDVGTWSALWGISPKDAAGNVAGGDVYLRDSSGCYVRSEKRHVVGDRPQGRGGRRDRGRAARRRRASAART